MKTYALTLLLVVFLAGDSLPDPTASGSALLADINRDNTINFDDFFLLVDQFGQGCEEGNCAALTADLNKDLRVNFDDFFLLVDQFGQTLTRLLQPLESQTVALGTTLALQLQAADPERADLRYAVMPLPLPANATFDAETGLFSFTPDPSQVGEIFSLAFAASATDQNDCRTIGIEVISAGTGITALSGRLLDTSDSVNGLETPVVGATVSLLGTEFSTTSDAAGFFTLSDIAADSLIIDIDGSTAEPAPDGSAYASFREEIEVVAEVENVVGRPFYLPRIAAESLTTVNPNSTTRVLNPTLEVGLEVQPNSARDSVGNLFSGQLSISEVPENLAPAALPETLEPGLLITIQPLGITFDPPAQIDFPNLDELLPGSEVDLWSLDPERGEFAVVGTGRVRADGAVIETVEGGVRATDWHFSLPPEPAVVDSTNNDDNQDLQKCTHCPTGSLSAMATGNLNVDHFTSTYRSLETDWSRRLVYNSLSADSQPIISANTTIARRAAVPPLVSVGLSVAGLDQGLEVFTHTEGLNESVDESVRQVVQFNATDYPTGRYFYRMKLTSHYPRSAVSNIMTGQVIVHNQVDSPFGAGWTLDELSRLYFSADGSIMIALGDGSAKVFEPKALDLNDWSQAWRAETGAWEVAEDGGSVLQTVNAAPTFFVGPEQLINTTIRGRFQVEQERDDDFIGFVMGFQRPIGEEDVFEFILLNWKQTTQSLPTVNGEEFLAEEGFTLSRFSGPVSEDLSNSPNASGSFVPATEEFAGFWGHTHPAIQEVLATNYGPGLGWRDNVEHRFELDYFSDRIRIVVDGEEIFDVSGSFPSGRFGFFNFSQSSVRYQGFVSSSLFEPPPGDFSALVKNGDGTFTRTMKDGTKFNYSADGLQTSTVNRNGNIFTYSYDSQDRLATIVDPVGLATQFHYSDGRLERITDPAGRVTAFEHDTAGDLIAITDPDGSRRSFAYDERHRMVSQTSKRGFDTSYEYNFAGRNSRVSRPDGSAVEIAPSQVVGLADLTAGSGTRENPLPVVRPQDVEAHFTDGNGNRTTHKTDRFGASTRIEGPLGRVVTISRDLHGNATQVTNPNGAISQQSYDANGNMISLADAWGTAEEQQSLFDYEPVFNQIARSTDPDGFDTRFDYDERGNLIRATDAMGSVRTMEYDSRGLPLRITDENGNITTLAYDENGNITTLTDALGTVTRQFLDQSGNLTRLVEAEGLPEERTYRFTYDSLNRLTSETDANGMTAVLRYDEAGNLVELEEVTGRLQRVTYDPLDRVITLSDPLTGTSQMGYDANGNLIESTNALGQQTTYSYDPSDRLIQSTDPLGGKMQYDYDESSNVRAVRDPLGQETTFTYDLLDRVTQRSNALGQTLVFTYGKRDHLISRQDPKGQVTDYSYDGLSRLTSITTSDNTIEIGFDKLGNRLSINDSDTQIALSYDALNRVVEEQVLDVGHQPAATLTHTYDALGNRLQLGAPAGRQTEYEYDPVGRMTRITTPALQAIDLAYDAIGQFSRIAFPNGLATQYEFDPAGHLSSLSHGLNTGTALAELAYEYDALGNVLSVEEDSQTRSFVYDALERLTQASSQSYSYDGVGNRLTSSLSAFQRYDGAHRLLEDDAFLYSYDANGNLETKTAKADSAVTAFTYNAQNQLVGIAFADGTEAEYRYDGLDRRIEKTVDGSITRYIYDELSILLEYDGANTLQASYTHGPLIDQPLSVERADQSFYTFADYTGSVRNLSDADGEVVNTYSYDAYGRLESSVEAVENPFAFTGREYDAESGLYFYRARYYDPNTGRFISEDPLGFNGGDVNLYRYVENNPVNLGDPLGLITARDALELAAKTTAVVLGGIAIVAAITASAPALLLAGAITGTVIGTTFLGEKIADLYIAHRSQGRVHSKTITPAEKAQIDFMRAQAQIDRVFEAEKKRREKRLCQVGKNELFEKQNKLEEEISALKRQRGSSKGRDRKNIIAQIKNRKKQLQNLAKEYNRQQQNQK